MSAITNTRVIRAATSSAMTSDKASRTDVLVEPSGKDTPIQALRLDTTDVLNRRPFVQQPSLEHSTNAYVRLYVHSALRQEKCQ